MATIINNPNPGPDRVVERVVETDGGSAGWAVAVIILIAVIAVGAYFWFYNRGAPAPQQESGTQINVTIPTSNPDSEEPTPAQ
ncbi:MAG: hypothetical protein Q7R54_01065 [bacterium]|nr:hypothetical protein [bacterium]